MVPLAIGTQTTGSTIRPSAFCGIVGYRPTYGEHRLHGVMEASGSLDTLGILARSVDDVALYRDVLLGIPAETVADAPPPHIGLCRTHVWDQIEPTSQALTERVAETLAAAGAKVSDVQLPMHFERLTEAHGWISSFEFARTFTWEMENHWDDISETIRANRISDGLSCSLDLYVEMQDLAERCRREMDDIFADYDVMMTPSAFGEAPAGWNPNPGAIVFKMWTTLHVPALALPVAKGPNGMPIGVQFFAKRHCDRRLFAHARWAHRRLS
jgi:amidase